MYKATDKTGQAKYYASKELKNEDTAFYCQGCGGRAILKAGDIKVPHFAHKGADCGYFKYKPMCEWHRAWQWHFPENRREVRMVDASKKWHIADAVNSDGLIIEFQHSKMPLEEKDSRHLFYEKMIWVLDPETYKYWLKDGQQTKEYIAWEKNKNLADYQASRIIRQYESIIAAYESVEKSINNLGKLIESSEVKDFINFSVDFSVDKNGLNDLYEKEKNRIQSESDKNIFTGVATCSKIRAQNESQSFWFSDDDSLVYIDLGSYLLEVRGNEANHISREAFFKKYIH